MDENRKPQTGLAGALLAFQAAAPTLAKDGRNPHFNSRFTPLDTIVETIQPLLAEHGLVWVALPCRDDDGAPALEYQLIHAATGELLRGRMPLLLTKQDPQGFGSALTYARRYALTAVLNLVADEDDDGNRASRRQTNGQSRQPTAAEAKQTERPANAKQRGLLNARAADAELCPTDFANAILTASDQDAREFDSEESAEQWLKRALDRLPAKLVDPVLKRIEALKDGAAA